MGAHESKIDEQQIVEIATEISNQFAKDFDAWYRYHITEQEKAKFGFLRDEEPLGLTYGVMTARRRVKTGFLVKMGKNVKNWKRRYVVLYNKMDNHSVRYYSDESMQREKGCIFLNGYHVRPFNVEEEKKLGSHGIVLQHNIEGRRCWLLKAENAREQAEWVQVLTAACAQAVHDPEQSKVISMSFIEAMKTTRAIYGLFGSCIPNGKKEDELLSELVLYVLQREVFEQKEAEEEVVHNELKAKKPSKVRPSALAAAREAQRKAVLRLVSPLAERTWKQCLEQAEEQGALLVHSLQQNARQVFLAEEQVLRAVDRDLASLVHPIALEQQSRVLEPFVSHCVDPLLAAWDKALTAAVKSVLDHAQSATALRHLSSEIKELAVHQVETVDGLLQGAARVLWRLESEDLRDHIQSMYPHDAMLVLRNEHNSIMQQNVYLMQQAAAGEDGMAAGAVGGGANGGGLSGERQNDPDANTVRPVDGRLYAAMLGDLTNVIRAFLRTVEGLLMRPETAPDQLLRLHYLNHPQPVSVNGQPDSAEQEQVAAGSSMTVVNDGFRTVLTFPASTVSNSLSSSTAAVSSESVLFNVGIVVNEEVSAGTLNEAIVATILQQNSGSNHGRSGVSATSAESESDSSLASSLILYVLPEASSSSSSSAEASRARDSGEDASGKQSPKEIAVLALRTALVLATRDIALSIRQRLRESALWAMEAALQESLLGAAADVVLEAVVSPAGESRYIPRPSSMRLSTRLSTMRNNVNVSIDGTGGRSPAKVVSTLPPSAVALLAEQRCRSLMRRELDRLLDRELLEVGRRLRHRVLRMLHEEVALVTKSARGRASNHTTPRMSPLRSRPSNFPHNAAVIER